MTPPPRDRQPFGTNQLESERAGCHQVRSFHLSVYGDTWLKFQYLPSIPGQFCGGK